jgi:hypothetical protein
MFLEYPPDCVASHDISRTQIPPCKRVDVSVLRELRQVFRTLAVFNPLSCLFHGTGAEAIMEVMCRTNPFQEGISKGW